MTRIADKEYSKVDNPVVGQRYHVAWAKKGCNWKLVEINNDNGTCTLLAPASQKTLENVKLSDLRHTRKNENQ